MNDFAIFIMVYGRPEKMWTYKSLRNQGYTGKIFLVGDDTDKTIDGYKKKYGDELIIFDKKLASTKMDSGDNTGDLRSTLFSANTIPDLAKEKGVKHFMIMCDDYTAFYHNFDENYKFKKTRVKSLDKIFEAMRTFLDKSKATTIAMSQGGDFLGGTESSNAKMKLMRKAMNTFMCSTDKPIKFVGRLNEDATTYTLLGGRGELFFTFTNVCVIQTAHQSQKSGLTDVYLDYGTYVKSFFAVMYNPSCVKIAEMGTVNKRIHHKISWNNAVPKIIDESIKKTT